ncbi:putative uncharacterized protein [Clostridium sp. CAG:557]|nr:putative uncharacterized protein [Clostridium sp. CAG:557]
MWFNNLLDSVGSCLYAYILIPLLVFAGFYFTFKTKFVQFRLLKDAFKSLTEKAEKGKVSSFKSLMISTASKIGVGHIAGIASGIIIGGPGAVFWMWFMAVLGSASAFIESTLAQIYKVKDENGGFRGGPAYYMQKAFDKKWLGVLFSCLLIAGYAYGFNALQSFQLSSALTPYIENYKNSIYPMIVGLILAVLTAAVIWGGTHRIGFISVYIVPIMSLAYISLSLYICIKNFDKFPDMMALIFKEAFNFKAIFGAFFYKSALVMGTKRGLFSNEAGMGSAPNAAATADVLHPVNQGLAQILSVFIDTLLICSATSFIVLLSGVDFNCGLEDIPFVQEAVKSQVGTFGVHLIAFSIFAFAFTSIIGNYCYAETNVLFIKNNKVVLNIFRITCVLAVFLGAQADARTVWNVSDLLMGLMAVVNILVILLIGNTAIKALKDYLTQKKDGKVPVFVAKDADIKNTDVWK